MSQTSLLEPPTTKPAARPPRRRRKLLYRVLWATLAAVLGACLYWTWCYRAALAERDALVAELHARGEPVWWEEVVAKALADQPEDSGAPLFRQALAAADTVWAQRSRSLPRVYDLERVRALFQDVKPSAEISEALRFAGPALTLIEEACRRPPGIVTPNLRDIEGLAWQRRFSATALRELLILKAYDALARGDPSGAYRTVALTFRSAEQFGDPLLIALVARLSIRATAVDCLLECLAHSPPSEREFAALDQLLSAHDDGLNVAQALIGERARQVEDLESDARLGDVLNRGLGWRAAFLRVPQRWMYVGWLHAVASPLGAPVRLRTQVELLRFTDHALPLVDRPDANPEALDRAYKAYLERSPLHQAFEDSRHLFPEWAWAGGPWLRRHHQRLVLTRLALRLRRHFDKYGRFPDELEGLCDAVMPTLPLAWFGNHSITYKPSAKGFRLELPAAIVPLWERYHLEKTPIPSEYGLEVELKKSP